MTQDAINRRTLFLALAILRVSLGAFLLMWALEKFVIPQSTVGIWKSFYLVRVGPRFPYVVGGLEAVLAVAIVAGVWRSVSYALGLAVHLVSVAATWRQLLDPWGLLGGGRPNHLFLAGVPVLAAFVALFVLREGDGWTVDGWRVRRASTTEAT